MCVAQLVECFPNMRKVPVMVMSSVILEVRKWEAGGSEIVDWASE